MSVFGGVSLHECNFFNHTQKLVRFNHIESKFLRKSVFESLAIDKRKG
jgi:hypothetical protein